MSLPFLAQQDAITVDEKLMGPLGFSVDQLMARPRAHAALPARGELTAESGAMAGPDDSSLTLLRPSAAPIAKRGNPARRLYLFSSRRSSPA